MNARVLRDEITSCVYIGLSGHQPKRLDGIQHRPALQVIIYYNIPIIRTKTISSDGTNLFVLNIIS